MSNMDHQKKSILALIVLITLVLAIKERVVCETIEHDEIKVGNYTLTISRESDKARNVSDFKCDKKTLSCEAYISDGFNMKITDEEAKKMLKAFRADYYDDTNIDYKEIKRQVLKKTKRITQKPKITDKKIRFHINRIQCYKREAFIWYEKQIYKITVKEPLYGGLEKIIDFKWEEHTDFELTIESEYDESLGTNCKIQGKKGAVKDRNNRKLRLCIEKKNIENNSRELFMIPLYWGEGMKIIQVNSKIPNEAIE